MIEEPLKPDFRKMLADTLGPNQASALCDALDTEPTTAIRLNPRKTPTHTPDFDIKATPQWCKDTGAILNSRPQFALMPLWHAGAFYVQEPASMIMSALAGSLAEGMKSPRWLDLCAAPGGKTTAVLAALPDNAFIVANEFDSHRASILAENIAKWGAPNVAITRGDTSWVRKLRRKFDIVAVDAPCSGEGMMRKESIARSQWSEGLVRQCADLQRQILSNAWEALACGGTLIYSTCTFNRIENEDNVRYMMENFGAESLAMPSELSNCGAIESLDDDIHALRFMPHVTEGEGLFIALLHKPGDKPEDTAKHKDRQPKTKKNGNCAPWSQIDSWLKNPSDFTVEKGKNDDTICAIPARHYDLAKEIQKACPCVMSIGIKAAVNKGHDLIPTPELALSTALSSDAFPLIELTEEEALDYLRRGTSGAQSATMRLKLEKKGYALVTYHKIPLGFIKNLGNRINNLYPASWRLRMN